MALVRRAGDGVVVADDCVVADRFGTRLRGLLGRRSLKTGEGLLLEPAGSVHTFGMRFAIDAVFLDGDGVIVQIAAGLKPWRLAGSRGATSTLELAAGTAAAVGLQVGETLLFE